MKVTINICEYLQRPSLHKKLRRCVDEFVVVTIICAIISSAVIVFTSNIPYVTLFETDEMRTYDDQILCTLCGSISML